MRSEHTNEIDPRKIPLTTEQEFEMALYFVGSCASMLRCGVDISGADLDAIALRYKCQEYIRALEELPA